MNHVYRGSVRFLARGLSVRKNISISSILFVLLIIFIVAVPVALAVDEDKAEDDKAKQADPKEAGLKEKVVVTATRTEEDVFQVPVITLSPDLVFGVHFYQLRDYPHAVSSPPYTTFDNILNSELKADFPDTCVASPETKRRISGNDK